MEKIRLLLYCTKGKPLLYKGITAYTRSVEYVLDKEQYLFGKIETLNGKIVAECDFEVEEIECRISVGINGIHDEYTTKSLGENELLYASKIDEITFINYLKGKNGYAIHIKNLNIFDEPRELNEYYNSKDYCKTWQPIKSAPQNMMYADYINIEQNMFRHYILISIRPEWLCKILNREKTIEVRKKVLKEMVK